MIERSPYPRMIAALLALLGLLDAAYLSVERITGGALACPIGGGCETVQSSAYALFLGVPVAYIGLAGYATLLAAALLALNVDEVAGVPVPAVLLALAGAGVLFALYLSYLQVAVIGAICFWCVVSALLELGILIAALIDWRMLRRPPTTDQGDEETRDTRHETGDTGPVSGLRSPVSDLPVSRSERSSVVGRRSSRR